MGFLSFLGFGRPTGRRATRNEQDATPAQSPPATPWVEYRNNCGRPCWYNKKTKQTTYSTPYGNAGFPVAGFPVAVPPQHFWPVSPYPGRFHHHPPWSGIVPPSPVVVHPPPPPPEEEKKEEKNDKKGYWKEVFSELDGEKHWRHTVTKKKTYTDPYV